ncbi:hypothetical protein ABZ085_23985, partial [Streptomyces albidoflavus]
PIPRILSDLFSERFGCVVAVEGLGLRPQHQTPSAAGVDLPWTGPQTIAHLSEFSRSDLMLARRGFLGTSLTVAAGASLIEPMQRWLVPTPQTSLTTDGPQRVAERRRGPRLSSPELELLESTIDMFRRWDAQCGGGLRRKAVVGQLHEVTELLQEPHPAETTRRLYRVAAELAELAGWMSYDVGLQPTAQKYFVLALHAAKEADDKPLGSYVLSHMSRQMIHLGRPDDALELVHLAQYGSRDCAGPRTQAMLYAMEARAHAALGNPGKCKRAARMAEATFAELEDATGPEPSWIKFFTEAELSSENAHSYRDLAYAAGGSTLYANLSAQGMRQAVDLFREDSLYQRSYALNLIGMASVHLLRDELADSAVCAEEAAHLAAKVRSERVNTRLRKTVDRALRQYPGRSETDALAELLASHLPEAAQAV